MRQIQLSNLKLKHKRKIEIGSDLPFDPNAEIIHLVCDSEDEDVPYLLEGWIPYGLVTGIVGPSKSGKSCFVIYGIMRTVTTGCNWFDGTPGPDPSNVLWCPTERDEVLNNRRIRNWKLPQERIILASKNPSDLDLTSESSIDAIERKINQCKIPLVIVDSLSGGHKHRRNENNARIGIVLNNLAGIATRTKAAVVVTHQSRKLRPGRDIQLGDCSGSTQIASYMKSMVGVQRLDEESEWRKLNIIDENLGIKPRPLGFRVTNLGLEFGDVPKRLDLSTKKGQAKRWLESNMVKGKIYKARDLTQQASERGIDALALARAAKNDLRVVIERVHKDGKLAYWTWKLP